MRYKGQKGKDEFAVLGRASEERQQQGSSVSRCLAVTQGSAASVDFEHEARGVREGS
jgi:hypothetical protein